MLWTHCVRKSDTYAGANSIANTAVSSANLPCETANIVIRAQPYADHTEVPRNWWERRDEKPCATVECDIVRLRTLVKQLRIIQVA